MIYGLKIRRSAQKSLSKISQAHRSKIIESIRTLANAPKPNGSKKLSGREAWRVRIGDYRVIYEIHKNELILLVIDVGHRREIYKRKN